MIALSPKTLRLVRTVFSGRDRAAAARMLESECGEKAPFCDKQTSEGMERIRFAAIKVSGGRLKRLSEATRLAQIDWRDLLMAAGFGYTLTAHEEWAVRVLEDAVE